MGKITTVMIPEDLKDVFVRALKKYKNRLTDQAMDAHQFKLTQRILTDEIELVDQAMKILSNHSGLPAVQEDTAEKDQALYQSLCELQKGEVGAIYGFTVLGKTVTITYTNAFMLKIEECVVYKTKSLQEIYDQMLSYGSYY